MNVDNLKLRTKLLIPLIPLTIAVVGLGVVSAIELSHVGALASAIIAHGNDLQAQLSGALLAVTATGAAFLILTGAASIWMSRAMIARPLVRLAETMRLLSQGELTVEIEGRARNDEIGDIANAAQAFKDAAIENARLKAAAANQKTNAQAERDQAQLDAIERERQIVGNAISLALSKLAGKDLTYRMPADAAEDYENYRVLQSVFNSAVSQIEEAMAGVTSSAGAIHSGAQEISSASDDLSRRTEQQAASLEETAAALDEITATVTKSAEGAAHAREVVAAADEDAKNSAVVVRQAVEAMDAIAKSAQQINQIIGVIDEIAFQTNLLALNAGVEAARAGDAGRGFAVVASEVRALAQRSAEAAKKIKGLISASTVQVDHGVKLVAATGQSLQRIMAQVAEINGVVREIAVGAKEQATGLAQVNSSINQMDQVTQQNATMVQQSNAASRSLSQETEQLASLIGQFEVGAGGSDRLRRELQKVAPHAFAQSGKATLRKGAGGLSQRLARVAATGAAARVAEQDAADWQEF